MVNWDKIDTILLDMDGTLLDLYFDNYFWREHVPKRYAELHSTTVEDAKRTLMPIFRGKEGTIDWYCVDYWTHRLGLDIALLKQEVDHLIAVHPYVIDFLDQLNSAHKKVALVTNAHQKSLMLKMDKTNLHQHIEHIICAHDFGIPKENPEFWDKLHNQLPFAKRRTLLIDDSLSVLRSARQHGIEHLLAVYEPDSQDRRRDVAEFEAIESFAQIMPVV